MIRVRIPDVPSPRQVLSLDSDQSHHLSVVLRVRPGDAVTALTSEGARWICEVVDASGPVQLRVLRLDDGPDANPEGTLEVTMALLKGGKTDDLIRQLTELGASSIVVYTSQRCVARLDPARAQKKLARWRTIAEESTRQCDRTDTPTVGFHEGLPPGGDHHVFLWEEAPLEPCAREAMVQAAEGGRLTLLIGPEGGLEPTEASELVSRGWRQSSLGPRVMRAETAVVAAAVLALVALGERGY